MKQNTHTGGKMSRADFLKYSTYGLGGLFLGLKVSELDAAESSPAPRTAAKELYESWKSPWQPEVPQRLSKITHELAWKGLSGENGRTMKMVDWNPQIDPALPPQMKYAAAAKSIAENAPLRILPGELIVGSATLLEAMHERIPILLSQSVTHTTLDFERILPLGYNGLRKQIRERLAAGTLDEKGRELNEAALLTLDAADIWQQRNIALLEQMMGGQPAEGKAFYQTIIDTLKRVPDEAPRSFREAVQSLWSMYAFLRLMGDWSGIGRIDRMLGPYLKEDLRKGVLTLDEAREILAHFWIKGTEWIGGFYVNSGDAQFYQNIILGGIDKDGKEVTNEVTYLVLDIVEELHISDFPIAVRLGDKTPEKLIRRIAEVQRFGGGIVSVYSENIVIEGLVKFGYPLEEAREFTNDGCWEAIIPGKTAFTYAANDMLEVFGKTLHLNDETPVDFPDFESLYAAFKKNLEADVDVWQGIIDPWWKDVDAPCTLPSIFTYGCLEKGRCFRGGGPKYNMIGIHYGGVSDTANSLLVLKKLVYEEGYLSLGDFVGILRKNWEGNEGLRQLIRTRFTFYGNDDAAADAMMNRVYNDYTEIVGRCKDREGVKRPCGISTFGREIDWRMQRRATPEGSRIGDILATNCSPTPGSDRKGPTSALNSYCKLDFTRCPSGATLELKVLPSSVKGENGVKALMGLLKTFREKKGFYMHVDVVDTATLIDAQRNPEKYPNLPVRVAGWSARFTTLCKEWQDMIIQRTQQIC
ncbi:MAG: hypothetical protein J6X89_05710 [Bacteroidales bacterium]|nr:hypothetical protein [Bacteroidales bacterium]